MKLSFGSFAVGIITLLVAGLGLYALVSLKWGSTTLIAIGGGVLLLLVMVIGQRLSIKQAEFKKPEDD